MKNKHCKRTNITFLIAYLYRGGAAPENLASCDVNNSGTAGNPDVNLLDITYLISYLYKDGPEPACL